MEERKIDIHKAAGVLIKDRKFLITRSKGKGFFIAPGGKLEVGESVTDALTRELKEELQIDTNSSDMKELGTFYALAAGHDDKHLQMDVLIVEKWQGEIIASAEVEEIMWIDSNVPTNIELGSIFLHDVLPKLKSLDLID
jgi:8-oxo-dGTP pyrophosphatase MutT (NUDIX family)